MSDVRLGADTSDLDSGIKTAQRTLGSYRSDAGRVGKVNLEADASGVQRGANEAIGAIGKVRAAVGRGVRLGVDVATSGLDRANQAIADVRSAATRGATLDLDADTSGLEEAKSQVLEIGRLAGAVALGTVAADAGGGFVENINTATTQVGRLQGSLGITRSRAVELGRVAQQVFSSNWGESLEEANDAVVAVAQGLGTMNRPRLTRTLTEQALTLQDLSKGAMGFSESVRAVSSMHQNMGVSATRAFDLLAIGQTAGANRADDLLDTMTEYAPAFQQLGLSADAGMRYLVDGMRGGARDTDALGDAVLELGNNLSEAYRPEVGSAFREIGLNAENIRSQFEEGGPAAEQALQKIFQGLAGVDSKQKQAALGQRIFGTTFERLRGKPTAALAESAAKLGEVEGASKRAGAEISDNLGSKIGTASRQLQTFAGGTLNSAINKLGEWGAKLRETAQSEGGGGPFGSLLRSAIDLRATILPQVQDAVSGIGSVFTDTFARLGSMVKPALADLSAGFTALKPAMGPIVAFLGGALKGAFQSVVPVVGTLLVGALRIGAFAFRHLAEAVGWVGQKLQPHIPLIEKIGQVVGYIFGTVIVGAIGKGVQAIGFLASKLPYIGRVAGPVFSLLGKAISGAANIAQKTFSFIGGAVGKLGSTISSRLGFIRNAFSVAWQWIGQKTSQFGSTIGGAFSRAGSAISSRWTTAVNRVKALAGSAWQWVTQRTSQLGDSLRNVFTQAGTFISQRWTQLTTAVRTKASQMWSQVTSLFNTGRTRVSQVATQLKTFVTGAFTQLGQAVGSRVTSIWRSGVDRFTQLKNSAGEIFNSLKTNVSNRVRELGSNLSTSFTNQWNKAKEIYGGLRDSVGTLFNAAKQRAAEAIRTLGGNLISSWENQIERAKDFGESIKNTLGAKFGEAINRVRSWLGSLMFAVGNVLDVIGAPQADDAKQLGGQLKEPTKLAKGGVFDSSAFGARMMQRGGVSVNEKGGMSGSGIEIGDQGGVGTGKRIVAITNEAGPEAVIPLDKITAQGNHALAVAAASRNMTLVPKSPDHYGDHFHGPASVREKSAMRRVKWMEKGGVSGKGWNDNLKNYPTSRGGYNWLPHVAQIANLVAERIGSSPSTYVGHSPHETQAIDFMQANRADQPGDTIADFLWGNASALGLDYEIWKQRIRGAYAGDSWQGMADRGSDTQNHYDHVHGSFRTSPGSGEVSSNATYQGGAGGFDILGTITDAFKKVGEFPGLGLGWVGEGVATLGPMLLGKAKDWLVDKATDLMGSLLDAGRGLWGKITGGGTPAQNIELGRKMQEQMGVRGSFSSLESLWHKESGWNQYAENASSGAYGIPQSLPPTKLPAEGQKSGGSKPGPQIGWGLDYIKGRYGSTDAAWSHSQANNWYKLGGRIPGMRGEPKVIGAHAGEIVLPEGVADEFELFTEELHMLRRSGMLNGSFGGSGGSQVEQREVVRVLNQVVQVLQQDRGVTRSQRIENVEEVAATLASVMPFVTESPKFKQLMDKAMGRSIRQLAGTIGGRG